ncbi:hypothetical protein MLD38_030689 [Melastoma candidum]|uniref:Uncharacterized protein n=1 Tax=Melastoma candidum TaxID=119954 RepID=A0ACB9MMY9_9MYRT|nr:hypothetical protein MLD38_030689 [Melastoma candidum]
MGSLGSSKIPVIDFTRPDLKQGTDIWFSTTAEVCAALSEIGCFLALFDRVPPNIYELIFREADNLFDLPVEVKVKNVSDKPYHGYVGQMAKFPLHEGIGVDYATEVDRVREFTQLMWPKGNNNFSEVVYSYSKIVEELDDMVVRMIFEHYGIEKHYDSHKASKSYLLRFLKYGVPTGATDEGEIGVPRHTDKTFLSILHQNQVNGLEIQTKDGEWIGIDLAPSSLVVMAGEASMAWSNDRIYPCVHRVMMKAAAKRYTLALFSFISGMVKVPEELIDEEHPLQYEPFNNTELVQHYASDANRLNHGFSVKVYFGVKSSVVA